jgi:hypothetical protein
LELQSNDERGKELENFNVVQTSISYIFSSLPCKFSISLYSMSVCSRFIVAKLIGLQISHFTDSEILFALFLHKNFPTEINILMSSTFYATNKFSYCKILFGSNYKLQYMIQPITVAVQSKALNIFPRFDTGIMGSSPT